MDSGYTFKSKAHRLFFAKVTRRGVFNYTYNDDWDDALGENGAAVLRGFLNDKLVESAPTDVAIDKLFTVDELKPHLKARGLKVGGKKSDLVARILAADPAWAESQARAAWQYRRTTLGQVVADDIYDAIGREEGEMEARLLLLVHDRRYEEAFRTWAEWDADEVFPRDAWQGIDNRKTDPSTFVNMARRIESLLPVGERERTILSLLYGRSIHDPNALEALHAASYERDLIEYKSKPFVVGVEVKPSPSASCQKAASYAGFYRIENAPDYPFGPCDHHEQEDACLCWWQPVFDSDGITEWKIPLRRHPLVSGPAPTQSHEPAIQQATPNPWWRKLIRVFGM